MAYKPAQYRMALEAAIRIINGAAKPKASERDYLVDRLRSLVEEMDKAETTQNLADFDAIFGRGGDGE